MSDLPAHVLAVVRDVNPLGALVGRVLGQGPQPVEGGRDLAVAVLVPEGATLPQVATVGPWTEPVMVGGSMLRAAAVRSKVARELAATHSRNLAVKLSREAPQGCAWALFYESHGAAVLCTRPAVTRSGNTPNVAGAA